MTILLWITAISIGLYVVTFIADKISPSTSGDDYMGVVILRALFYVTAIFAALTFLSWIEL